MKTSVDAITFPRPVTPDGQPDALLRDLVRDNPVLPVVGPGGAPAWLVGGHDLVLEVLSDPARFSNVIYPPVPNIRANMALLDPPEHTRLRRLAAQAFTARRVRALVPGIQRIVAALLDHMELSGPPLDLVDFLARPLPGRVICQILGIPQDDWADLQRWTTMFTSMTTYQPDEIDQAVRQMQAYMERLVAARRSSPGNDVLSNLIRARDGADALSEEELVATILLLLVAGTETTMKALTRGVLILCQSGQLTGLAPGRIEVQHAVEEVLRHQAPIDTALFRWAKVDTELAGARIRAGDQLYVSLHLANYDPGHRSDPHLCDPGRADAGHLSFGHGVHFCLGAALARAELAAVFEALAARFPGLRLSVAPADLTWSVGSMLNAPASLPVTW
jgi:cytochrome P450